MACRSRNCVGGTAFLKRAITSGAGMNVSDAKRLKELEAENARLKKLLAESMPENEVTQGCTPKKVVKAPTRRELVHHLANRGLSERHALRVVGMSTSAYRYQPAPDRSQQGQSDRERSHKR